MAPQITSIPNPGAEGISYYTPAQIPPAGKAYEEQPDGKPIPKLFQPIKIRGLEFHNRIWLSPLCQYSAQDGHHTSWHQAHLGGIISRGPGLGFIEATSVTPEGRITPQDAGIWKDSQIEPYAKTVEFVHSQNQKIGIQLAHAGRKASHAAPWLARSSLVPEEDGGWPTEIIAPSAIPFDPSYPVAPLEASEAWLDAQPGVWAEAAKRALKAGFDVIEIHNAHGYFLHEMVSPVSNKRTDKYGGSFENRTRLTLEIVKAVRAVIPDTMPLFIRISATDWLEYKTDVESWKLEDTIKLAHLVADLGVDLIDVSSGGNHHEQKIETKGPNGAQAYQAHFSKAVKDSLGGKALVSTVGSINNGKLAAEVIDSGSSDVVFVGRHFQKNPFAVWQFAEELGVEVYLPHQIEWAFKKRPAQKTKEFHQAS